MQYRYPEGKFKCYSSTLTLNSEKEQTQIYIRGKCRLFIQDKASLFTHLTHFKYDSSRCYPELKNSYFNIGMN